MIKNSLQYDKLTDAHTKESSIAIVSISCTPCSLKISRFLRCVSFSKTEPAACGHSILFSTRHTVDIPATSVLCMECTSETAHLYVCTRLKETNKMEQRWHMPKTAFGPDRIGPVPDYYFLSQVQLQQFWHCIN